MTSNQIPDKMSHYCVIQLNLGTKSFGFMVIQSTDDLLLPKLCQLFCCYFWNELIGNQSWIRCDTAYSTQQPNETISAWFNTLTSANKCISSNDSLYSNRLNHLKGLLCIQQFTKQQLHCVLYTLYSEQPQFNTDKGLRIPTSPWGTGRWRERGGFLYHSMYLEYFSIILSFYLVWIAMTGTRMQTWRLYVNVYGMSCFKLDAAFIITVNDSHCHI